MPDSLTPLSDCITRLIEQNTAENYAHFLKVFMRSRLGIILTGMPPGTSGQYVARKDELTAALGTTPDGKKMLLACADRAIFVQRFTRPFNAEVDAIALLRMALANPTCEGIMINSAASEHTIGILRGEIPDLIANEVP